MGTGNVWWKFCTNLLEIHGCLNQTQETSEAMSCREVQRFWCVVCGDFSGVLGSLTFRPWKVTATNRKGSSSNHHFSGRAVKLRGCRLAIVLFWHKIIETLKLVEVWHSDTWPPKGKKNIVFQVSWLWGADVLYFMVFFPSGQFFSRPFPPVGHPKR